MDKMREAFEKWIVGRGLHWAFSPHTWEAWQAAQAESAQTIAEKEARIAELVARIKEIEND